MTFSAHSWRPTPQLPGGDRMDGSADRLLDLMHQLEDFTHTVSPEQAHAEFDQTTLQLFWMRWPQLSAWSGSLWRLLSEEPAGPSGPPDGAAAQIMLLNGFRHLPVMQGRQVYGVVSLRDLFAARISRPTQQRGAPG